MQIIKRYVDFSFSQPDAAAVRSAGYAGVCVYTDSALPNAAQLQAYRQAGLEILFIKEGGATDAYDGYAVGVAQAISANDRLDSVGAPADCAIAYVLADAPYTDASRQSALAEFAQGVRSVGRRGFKVGYGNETALRFGGPDWWWGVETWSDSRNGLNGWDGKTPPVAMIQMANSRLYNVPGYDTDENLVLVENFGQWGANSSALTDPTNHASKLSQKGQKSMLIFTDSAGNTAEFYRAGTKLYARYYLADGKQPTYCISDPAFSGGAVIELDPDTDLLPVFVFGVTLVHAALKDGRLCEAYPTAFGYLTRII